MIAFVGRDDYLANREEMLRSITKYVNEVIVAARESELKLLALEDNLEIERNYYWEKAKQQGYELGFEDCVNKETSKRY